PVLSAVKVPENVPLEDDPVIGDEGDNGDHGDDNATDRGCTRSVGNHVNGGDHTRAEDDGDDQVKDKAQLVESEQEHPEPSLTTIRNRPALMLSSSPKQPVPVQGNPSTGPNRIDEKSHNTPSPPTSPISPLGRTAAGDAGELPVT
ncbi:unnamed protein product, partial [Sphacelaria rigidula]